MERSDVDRVTTSFHIINRAGNYLYVLINYKLFTNS